jgi:ABC-2 type transport system ATP-binding protein
MNAAPTALDVRNLVVTRGARRVLDGVSLTLGAGEIVAVVGPNGAGKTTLLETIAGALAVKAGQVAVGGRPLGSLAERARWLGHLAGEAEPPFEARVAVVLDGAAGDRAWKLKMEAELGLADLRRARIGALSRGERRRVLLFETLAGSKPFLLLDEPTSVFDPLQLLGVIALLRDAAARGAGLLVTVHQMSDAEALASRILVLEAGRTVGLGSMAELRAQAGVPATASLHATFLALLRRERPRPDQGEGTGHEA